MSQHMYGLSYDYIQQNGRYLVMELRQGTQGRQLASLALKMLQSVTVPRLLPVHAEQFNLACKLVYRLDSKRMLGPSLGGFTGSIRELYLLLDNIVSAVEDSKLYMLDEQRYLLHEDLIFIGDDIADVYLVYVPLQELRELPPPDKQLHELLLRVSEKTGRQHEAGIRSLLGLLERETVPMAELREHLRQLLYSGRPRADRTESVPEGCGNGTAGREADHSARPQEALFHRQGEPEPYGAAELFRSGAGVEAIAGPLPGSDRIEAPQDEAAAPEAPEDVSQIAGLAQPVVRHKVSLDAAPAAFRELTLRESLMLLLPAALVLAPLWSRFADRPSEAWFYVDMGVTLLLGDIVFILSRIWRPRWRNRSASPLASGDAPASAASGRRQPLFDALRSGRQTAADEAPDPAAAAVRERPASASPANSAAKSEAAVVPNPSGAEAAAGDNASYYASLARRTTLLAKAPATVLLSAADADAPPLAKRARLEVRRDGHVEDVPLSETASFLIGRGPEGVQFVNDDVGVSRTHAEILLTEDQYMVRDLGSRNGSFLNGEFMVPYKLYPYREGDILTIVKTEFRFRLG